MRAEGPGRYCYPRTMGVLSSPPIAKVRRWRRSSSVSGIWRRRAVIHRSDRPTIRSSMVIPNESHRFASRSGRRRLADMPGLPGLAGRHDDRLCLASALPARDDRAGPRDRHGARSDPRRTVADHPRAGSAPCPRLPADRRRAALVSDRFLPLWRCTWNRADGAAHARASDCLPRWASRSWTSKRGSAIPSAPTAKRL